MFGNLLKKIFGAKEVDFAETFSEFSKSLTLIIDLEQLKDSVISKIRETIHVDSILIYLYNADLNRFEVAEMRGIEIDQDNQCNFFPDDPLIRWLTINEVYLQVAENPAVVSFLSDYEQDVLDRTRTELVFPLLVMNRVTGLVCIGPKSNGESFKPTEIELLNTLLGQASFAFENAYLYQQQKTRLRKMYRADRLATLGQLAAGAAHEIRNPLTSIRSTIQYLQKDLQNTDKGELVGELIGEVDRINEIIEGLLSFSKPSKPLTEKVNLKALIAQTLSLVATTAKKRNIEILFTFSAQIATLQADPSQLKQVFLNIIMNGMQAMDDGGVFTITVDLKKREGLTAEPRMSFYMEFKDTGEGIPKENVDHLFDPFFTTKKDGTGLGLSISYGIISQHGGDIEITSKTKAIHPKDHGTTVSIILPILK